MDTELNKITIPYLTTPYLIDLYSRHKHPRDKVKNLLIKGDLIHIRQGLYLLGAEYQKTYSKEVLAGMIYGPSAISLEYALSYHGLIPERVEAVTSICFKRNKKFSTPIGPFTYRYISSEMYPLGIDYIQSAEGNFFMASPEKALCDLAYDAKITSDEEALEYLLGSLRVEEENLRTLNVPLLQELSQVYKRRSTQHVVQTLLKLQKKTGV